MAKRITKRMPTVNDLLAWWIYMHTDCTPHPEPGDFLKWITEFKGKSLNEIHKILYDSYIDFGTVFNKPTQNLQQHSK